ncbi:MAG: IS200/IS605 family transposase [Acidobacteriota bacterium]|jgi:REP element-mobilizing transposase RayT|nr:IS200/IS605 family transposase [Acidobacteriota bacterium]
MSQSLSKILVHIIFSTKERFPFLMDDEMRKRTHAYLAQIFNEHKSHAIEVGGTTDHVHILCHLSRNYSVSDIIGKAKANSSSWVKAFGGRCAKFSWQSGYGAFSVDPAHMDPVRSYIRNQAEHHRNRTFQEEFLEILRRYNIAYDERYIWT